jgi:flagellar biosynthesis/type III secretory pathway protein FliH
LVDLDLAPSLAARNPVARVIEAHRLAQATKSDVKRRRTGKLGLVRSLLESGMAEIEVREVMRLIHWLLALPKEEEVGFRKDVKEMEATMQTIRRSTYEQIVWEEGVEKGIETGLEQGLKRGLEVGRQEGRHEAAQELLLELIEERFGELEESMRRRIVEIRDEVRLRQLARAVFQKTSLDAFQTLLESSDGR